MTTARKTLTPSTLRIGKRYRASRVGDGYDAIVIGSGIGGLTTAACLARQGRKVAVLEQHYTAGGFTHAYARNGYEWDVGVHYIGDMGSPNTLARRLFDYITDGELQWAPMDANYDRFYIGDEQYDLMAGRKAFREGLVARFPKEAAAIDRYLELLDEVSSGMRLFTLTKALPHIPLRLLDRLLGAAVPRAVRWLLPASFNRTTWEVLSELTKDEKLIAVLTGQWGDCGVPPRRSSFIIHALIAKHYLYGGYYPVGGASRIAETIIPVIQSAGGDVFTYADVTGIVVKDGRATGVTLADGHTLEAPLIISNAGVINTFEKLLPAEAAAACDYPRHRPQVKPSMAHLNLFIGLKGTPEELGLPRTNYWIYPSEHYDREADAFMQNPGTDFPLIYISFPAAKDPSFQSRYPGRSTIEIVAPATWEQFERWRHTTWGKRGDDYEQLKAELTDTLLEKLFARLPQLRGHIDYCELSTPLSTDWFCRYSRGEIYGLEHDPERFRQDWLKPATAIRGLYLTGQDVLSCGVVGAMISGLVTTIAIEGLKSLPLARQIFLPGKSSSPSNGVAAGSGA